MAKKQIQLFFGGCNCRDPKIILERSLTVLSSEQVDLLKSSADVKDTNLLNTRTNFRFGKGNTVGDKVFEFELVYEKINLPFNKCVHTFSVIMHCDDSAEFKEDYLMKVYMEFYKSFGNPKEILKGLHLPNLR